jgi:hypothetical protein
MDYAFSMKNLILIFNDDYIPFSQGPKVGGW